MSPSSDITDSAPAILPCRLTNSTSLVHEFGAGLIDTSNEGSTQQIPSTQKKLFLFGDYTFDTCTIQPSIFLLVPS